MEWRKLIAERLQERNRNEVATFNEIIVYSKQCYDSIIYPLNVYYFVQIYIYFKSGVFLF